MKKILFVCFGNVGRSQMAEAFYNHLTNSNDSWSAGIQKDTPMKYGNPAPKVVDSMLELGIDISQAKVKTINQKIIDKSEKIIIMCKKEQCQNSLLEFKNIVFWNIEDPFEMTLDKTKNIRDKIKNKVSLLLNS